MTATANQIRDTPGRLLVAWAVLFSSLVLLSWRIHIHHGTYDWLEFPTGLGNRDLYLPAANRALGDNDFFEPNLRFTWLGQDYQLYRRLHHPTRRDDAAMRTIAIDETNQFHVYIDSPPRAPADGSAPARFYLKTADEAYIEFGAKLFYPPFENDGRTASP